ncbi:MAG: hypothetical protein AVDCRST_MAG48-1272, partial [uncultured Friedmanniella sp.]
ERCPAARLVPRPGRHVRSLPVVGRRRLDGGDQRVAPRPQSSAALPGPPRGRPRAAPAVALPHGRRPAGLPGPVPQRHRRPRAGHLGRRPRGAAGGPIPRRRTAGRRRREHRGGRPTRPGHPGGERRTGVDDAARHPVPHAERPDGRPPAARRLLPGLGPGAHRVGGDDAVDRGRAAGPAAHRRRGRSGAGGPRPGRRDRARPAVLRGHAHPGHGRRGGRPQRRRAHRGAGHRAGAPRGARPAQPARRPDRGAGRPGGRLGGGGRHLGAPRRRAGAGPAGGRRTGLARRQL